MRRILTALATVGLLVGLAAGPVAAAPGGVDRYEMTTTPYTIAVWNSYIHNFVVTTNPCDGTITITGATPVDSSYFTTETITGTLSNGVISFTATYDGPYSPGFVWSSSFPVAGGLLSADPWWGSVTRGATTLSAFKNHGDFVSSMGGGSDAAHSCIGMPIN